MNRFVSRASSFGVPLAMFAVAALLTAGCPAPGDKEASLAEVAPPTDSRPVKAGPAERPKPEPQVELDEPAQRADPIVDETAKDPKPESDTSDELQESAQPAEEVPNSEQDEIDSTDQPPVTHTTGGYGKSNDEIDFVEINGNIFEGWEKPQAALLFSGLQHGYIEPCGCAGLEKKKGGVGRRHTLLKQLAEQGWLIAPFEVGGLVRRLGTQAELKYAATTDALQKMDYQVVGFGIDDLRLPVESLIATIKPGEEPHFVSANVGFFDFDSGLTQPFKVVQVGDMKFGVTTVLGEAQRGKLRNAEIVSKPAADALPAVIEKMKAAGADKLMLLVSGEPDEAQQLAKQIPGFDFVVSPGHTDPPPMRLEKIDGTNTQFIELSHKGMYVGVLGFYDDPEQPIRYQRVPLDGRFKESPEIVQVMVNYQDQLKALGWEGLGIKPLPDPGGREWIGSQTCADCHTEAHDVFIDTPHAKALTTLEELTPPRQHDAECISCHVVGWEPQRYAPYATGFRSREKTPELVHQGCENCHGGGKEHALIELGELDADVAQQDAARLAMRVSIDTESGKKAVINNCMQCHDLDNSPEFDFEKYWPQVEHAGLD